jgi:hypothetical protein
MLVAIADWLEAESPADNEALSPLHAGVLDFLAGSYSHEANEQGALKRAMRQLHSDARPFFVTHDPINELLEGATDESTQAWLGLCNKLASQEALRGLLLSEPFENLPPEIRKYIQANGKQLADEVDTTFAAHLRPYYTEHRYRFAPTIEQFTQTADQLRAASDVFLDRSKANGRAARMGSVAVPQAVLGAQRSLQKRVDKIAEEDEQREKPLYVLKRLDGRHFQFNDREATDQEIADCLHRDLARYKDPAVEADIKNLLQAIQHEPARATKYGNVAINIDGKRYPVSAAKVGDYPNVPTSSSLSRDIRVVVAKTKTGVNFILAHHKDQQNEVRRSLAGN